MSILNVNKINPVGGGSTITIAGIASVTSSVTAPSFVGAVTGNVTGNVTGDATGLSGNPSINTSGIITASSSTVSSGNVVIGTAGKGVDYSAQTASSLSGVTVSSELLDHYEEGTFTPTFGASNGSSTAGYSTQSGKYTRIGNIVHVQIRITLSSLVTNSHSHAWISGLPIASAERTATSSIVCGGMQGSGYNSFPIAGRTEANATRIELFQATNGGVTDFGTGDVSGTAYFIVQCTYRAA